MAGDFTLVIPTYNRPKHLARLLNYLEREKVRFPILILDSSTRQFRSEVRKVMQARSGLSICYLEFDETIKPFDKFYEGLCRVKTALCQLCADDDFIIIPTINECVVELKSNPLASVVHGHYFTFIECEVQGGMDITQILYYSPTIGSPQPLHRIKELFNHYQALTYGVYRTPALVKIMGSIKSVEQILARELLASALAVVYGTAVRLPLFTHGRSLGPSQSYQYWHPLEWLFRTPQGLFSAYQEYKETLVKEILSLPANKDSKENIEKVLDLIHLDYLLCHTPKNAFNFLLDKTLQGEKLDEIWQSADVQTPLTLAASKVKIKDASEKNHKSILTQMLSKMLKSDKTEAVEQNDLPEPSIQHITTKSRHYRLHPEFLVPTNCDKQVTTEDITQLTLALDNYY